MPLKIIIACILVLFTQEVLAQKSTAPWSDWMQHPCYKGLSISVKDMGYNADNKTYYWGVRIQNNYPKSISFRYLLSVGGEKENVTKYYYQQAFKLSPGSIKTDGDDVFTANMFKSSSNEWLVMVGDLCFDNMRCGGADDCYADCDAVAGKPNQPCGLTNSSAKNKIKEPGIESGEWIANNGNKMNIYVVEEGLISLRNSYVEMYPKITDNYYKYTFSTNKALSNEMKFSNTRKMDYFAQSYFQDNFLFNKPLKYERTEWVDDADEKRKYSIIKIEDGLIEFTDFKGALFYKKVSANKYSYPAGNSSFDISFSDESHYTFSISGKTSFSFHKVATKKDNNKSLSGKVKPEEGTCMIWQEESNNQKFKMKIASDGIYQAAIDGNFGNTPSWPKAGNGYQRIDGHSTWTLTFINDRRFMTTVNGQLSGYYNCVTDFENADEWVNIKDNYTVKLAKADGGVLFNGSGNVIFYPAISADTYQWSDRPCSPDCYKTIIRFTGKDAFSVDYTNLQGQVNQTDNFVRRRK